jgi:eukaryotic-like serine/threonine-protein kinase
MAAAAVVDHQILFGLIALQVGLIDQSQLVAALQAWTRDKTRPLADHLADRGCPDADGRSAVEAMVAVHVKKHGGDTDKTLASIPASRAISETLTRVGDAEIASTIAHIGRASSLPRDDIDGKATKGAGLAAAPCQRFRVLRPHAKGGLGAVFVALDTELHREVAVKQILDSHVDDPISRARFLLEAEVTGGLEHPGIVPVYSLGTYDDGRPYYAMRFIRGNSLKAAIEKFHRDAKLKNDPGRRSLELRMLLRRFTDVCHAMDYAHNRGVLHRDIKPSNIIVGDYGETLVVDWGLAKPLGQVEPGLRSGERPLVLSGTGGSTETLPGSALGTPAYMSPEQAGGDLERLGPWSDVYSLGATLYTVLTGKPPVEGADLGALLAAVKKGEIAQPRKLEPSIARGLEAVCLNAMALKP